MMKLYYAPGTCSLAPMILAEWLDLDLQLQRVNLRDPDADFLAANPLGAVPALELDGGNAKTQVDAILQYFSALRPEAGLGGGREILDQFEMHRWIAFLTGDFHPPFGVWFNPGRFTTGTDEKSLAAVRAAAARRIGQVAAVLNDQLSDGQHVIPGRRTLLDAYAFAMVRWLGKLEGGFDPYPNLASFMTAMKKDDGVQRALARESA